MHAFASSAAAVAAGRPLTSWPPPKTPSPPPRFQLDNPPTTAHRCHCCRRRHLLSSSAMALLPVLLSNPASALPATPTDAMQRFHPSRPDWYEKLYAEAMEQGMRSYEAEIAGYKEELFKNLVGDYKNVLEIGVGTGPNFKYYAGAPGINVFGVDPNKQMEKYARAAAVQAGLLPTNFSFVLGVGEDLPVRENSMDAVIGTLVLCSVKDVEVALREVKRVLKPGGAYLFIEHVAAHDGSLLRFMQSFLDPLQQLVADGCHLTRETGKQISTAGFSSLSLNTTFLSTASLISPHVYGIARN